MIFSSQAYKDAKNCIDNVFICVNFAKKDFGGLLPQGRSTTFAHRNAPFPIKGNSEDTTMDSTVLSAARTAGAGSVCKETIVLCMQK